MADDDEPRWLAGSQYTSRKLHNPDIDPATGPAYARCDSELLLSVERTNDYDREFGVGSLKRCQRCEKIG